MEAFADYNLWIWHLAFGFAGSNNDINIWDHQSGLLHDFLNGDFARDVDFQYTIAGTTFDKLYLLVDGIYPDLARFVKTIDQTVSADSKKFATWQESARKDIERAFGVLQRKFYVIKKPFELWHKNEISNVVECCVMIHNMMVAERVTKHEVESVDRYMFAKPSSVDLQEADDYEDPDEEFVRRHAAEIELQRQQ